MEQFFILLSSVVLVWFGTALLRLGLRILTAKKSMYVAAHKVSGDSVGAIIKGNLDPLHAGVRDFRIACGLAVDLKTNSLVAQGRVSDEVIHGVVK